MVDRDDRGVFCAEARKVGEEDDQRDNDEIADSQSALKRLDRGGGPEARTSLVVEIGLGHIMVLVVRHRW